MTRIIISGGGTGGHVFPAIAIANAIKGKDSGAEILFIGALGKMEMEKVPAAGYLIRGLWISGLQRRLTLKNLSFPFKVISSTWKAAGIIRKFKPDVVIGVGGYASGPTVRVAARKKIPTLIQEQNSYPGITNKILSRRADVICVAYEGMDRFFPPEKIILTGNPVRQDILDLQGKKAEAMKFFGLSEGKMTLLVIGGSLGAGTINRSVSACIEKGITSRGIQVIWQTGKFYFPDMRVKFPEGSDPDVHMFPFLDRVDLAYAAADMVVSRAGAIAISELCIIGKPAILIPSPNVAEDHQTRNAEALSRKGAAILVKDKDAESVLLDTIDQIRKDEALQDSMKKNIISLGIRDAAVRIAEEALKRIKKTRND